MECIRQLVIKCKYDNCSTNGLTKNKEYDIKNIFYNAGELFVIIDDNHKLLEYSAYYFYEPKIKIMTYLNNNEKDDVLVQKLAYQEYLINYYHNNNPKLIVPLTLHQFIIRPEVNNDYILKIKKIIRLKKLKDLDLNK